MDKRLELALQHFEKALATLAEVAGPAARRHRARLADHAVHVQL